MSPYVEVRMREDGGEVCFTEVWPDGTRHTYWLPFWPACWRCIRLIWRGVEVKDRMT